MKLLFCTMVSYCLLLSCKKSDTNTPEPDFFAKGIYVSDTVSFIDAPIMYTKNSVITDQIFIKAFSSRYSSFQNFTDSSKQRVKQETRINFKDDSLSEIYQIFPGGRPLDTIKYSVRIVENTNSLKTFQNIYTFYIGQPTYDCDRLRTLVMKPKEEATCNSFGHCTIQNKFPIERINNVPHITQLEYHLLNRKGYRHGANILFFCSITQMDIV